MTLACTVDPPNYFLGIPTLTLIIILQFLSIIYTQILTITTSDRSVTGDSVFIYWYNTSWLFQLQITTTRRTVARSQLSTDQSQAR